MRQRGSTWILTVERTDNLATHFPPQGRPVSFADTNESIMNRNPQFRTRWSMLTLFSVVGHSYWSTVETCVQLSQNIIGTRKNLLWFWILETRNDEVWGCFLKHHFSHVNQHARRGYLSRLYFQIELLSFPNNLISLWKKGDLLKTQKCWRFHNLRQERHMFYVEEQVTWNTPAVWNRTCLSLRWTMFNSRASESMITYKAISFI